MPTNIPLSLHDIPSSFVAAAALHPGAVAVTSEPLEDPAEEEEEEAWLRFGTQLLVPSQSIKP